MRRFFPGLLVVLGFVFVLAGLGRIFFFVQFAEAIARILHFRMTASGLLAGGIILVELIAGVALAARYRTLTAALLLFLAMGVHLWILSSAIMQGKEIQCHCFGVLLLGLSNRWEMMLEVFFLNFLVFVVFVSGRQTSGEIGRLPVLSAMLMMVVVLLEYAVLGPFLTAEVNPEDNSAAVTYAENLNSGFSGFRTGNRLLFMLEFSDFNCPPCFDDFMILCDEAKRQFRSKDSSRCFLMFRRGELANPENPSRLHQWLRSSGINFPAAVGPDSLFESPRFTKSRVMVISTSGRTLFSEILPIGSKNRERVLRLLADSYAPGP